MKKIYGMLLLFFVFVTGHAQMKKGSVLLGGQLSYFSREYKHDDNQRAEISRNGTLGISAGKAFRENNFVGLEINYTIYRDISSYNGSDSVRTKGYILPIGVFIRSYKKLAGNFYIFGQTGGGVIIGNQTYSYKSPTGEVKTTQKGAYISLTPGVAYQVLKKMQVEITIPGIINTQYIITKRDSRDPQVQSSRYNQFSFSSNLNNTNLGWLGVGFKFVL